MNESLEERQTRLTREKALYCYSVALEYGDLDAIAAVLQEATHDALLEEALLEMHLVDQQANGVDFPPQKADEVQPTAGAAIKALPGPVPPPGMDGRRRPLRRWWSLPQKLVAVTVVCLLLGSFLAVFIAHQGENNGAKPPVTGPSSKFVAIGLDQTIQILRASDGKTLWSSPIGHTQGIFVQDDTVYAAGVGGSFYALDALNGRVLWQQKVNGTTDGEVTILADENVVVVGYPVVNATPYPNGFNPLVAVFDRHTGHALWHLAASLGEFMNPLLGLDNNMVYVETEPLDGALSHGVETLALRETDGVQLWSHLLLSHTESQNGLASANNVLYLSSPGSLEALDAQTGKLLWKQQPAIGGAITLGGEQVYLHIGDELCAYAMNTGSMVWCQFAEESNNLTAIFQATVFMDGKLYVGRTSDKTRQSMTIEAKDPSTGNQLWSIPGIATFPNFVGAYRVLYVPEPEGVAAVRGSDGHQLWLANMMAGTSLHVTALAVG